MNVVIRQMSPYDAIGAELTGTLKREPYVRLQSVHSHAELLFALLDADALIISSALYSADIEQALTQSPSMA